MLDKTAASLPFPDKSFDVVFCSSVIEHVTVDEECADRFRTTEEFERAAYTRQRQFADEIRRIAKKYFVQTPNKYFLIESHTWLPSAVLLLSRPHLVKLIRFMNKWWPKKTPPVFNLLRRRQMQELFPDAEIIVERSWGLEKSIMAIKR